MDVFKLDVDSKYTYSITIANIEEQLARRAPWFQCINGHDGWFAVCPGCNNPIQIIGMFQGDKLYGRHFVPYRDELKYYIKGAVDHEEREYCQYYSKRKSINRDTKRPATNELAKAIKTVLIEQFDRVVYLLSKSSGLQISLNLAKQMLEDYNNHEGWRYRGATLDNIPWAFAYMLSSQKLFGKKLLDTNLINELRIKAPMVDIDMDGRVSNKTGYYLNLSFCFIHHKQELMGNHLNESIQLVISDNDVPIIRKTIECDHEYFNNLVKSNIQQHRQLHLVELAKSILL